MFLEQSILAEPEHLLTSAYAHNGVASSNPTPDTDIYEQRPCDWPGDDQTAVRLRVSETDSPQGLQFCPILGHLRSSFFLQRGRRAFTPIQTKKLCDVPKTKSTCSSGPITSYEGGREVPRV